MSSTGDIFNQVRNFHWKFRPTRRRDGSVDPKNPVDKKEIIYIESNLFKEPTILAGNIESHSKELFSKLKNDEGLDLSRYHVLTCGDMAGHYIRNGKDANPSSFYHLLMQSARVKSLHAVQGARDIPLEKGIYKEMKYELNLIKQSLMENGKSIPTPLGRIGAVNGIISRHEHPYKLQFRDYMEQLRCFRQPRKDDERAKDFVPIDILMTHDAPGFKYHDKRKDRDLDFNGNDAIYDEVMKIKPKIHIYSRFHQPKLRTIHNGIHFLNVHGRVVIIEPLKETTEVPKENSE